MATKRTRKIGKSKRSAVKDLPPKNARKVKGGWLGFNATQATASSILKSKDDSANAVIQKI